MAILTVGTSYLIAYLLKFIANGIIPLIKYPLFEKVPFFLDGLHIGALKMRILASSGRFNQVVVFVPNSIKKSKFRPSRACLCDLRMN